MSRSDTTGSGGQARENVFTFETVGCVIAAMAIFQFAGGQAFFADDNAMRNPDELSIRELDAWPNVAIIEQYGEAQRPRVPDKGLRPPPSASQSDAC